MKSREVGICRVCSRIASRPLVPHVRRVEGAYVVAVGDDPPEEGLRRFVRSHREPLQADEHAEPFAVVTPSLRLLHGVYRVDRVGVDVEGRCRLFAL
jgi:hypothetical protein